MEKVIVIVGPTGVGKTKMGVALAKYFNGEVISGDSMQIYKTMDIGTAKVTVDEMEGIKHHLIDIKEPTESYSVKDFQDEVRLKIKEISSRCNLWNFLLIDKEFVILSIRIQLLECSVVACIKSVFICI